jgi:hypothetical protein
MLPVWLQMLTARLEEEKLFKIAHVLEQSLNLWDSLIPKGYEA